MRSCVNDIKREEIELVREGFSSGISIQQIMEFTNLDYYEVLYCITELFPNVDISHLRHCEVIEDETIILMADLHIGSRYENPDYYNEVKRFASENGIHTILRGGDIIQSTYHNVRAKYRDELLQLEHLVQDYPYDKSIRYLDLFGNHDFHTFVRRPECMEIYSTREDFHYLGVRYVYLDWKGYTIVLHHPTNNYKIPIPRYHACFSFRGHGHKPRLKHINTLWLPASCDDVVNYKREDVKPGFFVGTLEELANYNSMNFDYYYFDKQLKCEENYCEKRLCKIKGVD